jgi:hypothetical protein
VGRKKREKKKKKRRVGEAVSAVPENIAEKAARSEPENTAGKAARSEPDLNHLSGEWREFYRLVINRLNQT